MEIIIESLTEKGKLVLEALIAAGWIKTKLAEIVPPKPNVPTEALKPIAPPIPVSGNRYKGNGLAIEFNLEDIAKEFFGICEPYKEWKKQLKEAIEQYGHDSILDSFYEWAESMAGNFMGRRPMDTFFKNVGQRIVSAKPFVSNPLLDKMEKGVALLTDNKVFFTGEYRVRLAVLLKEHGLNTVSQAFAEFWQGTDEKGIQWAAREFLQQAAVRIHTIKMKEQQAIEQAKAVAQAVELAKTAVIESETEEEEDGTL